MLNGWVTTFINWLLQDCNIDFGVVFANLQWKNNYWDMLGSGNNDWIQDF